MLYDYFNIFAHLDEYIKTTLFSALMPSMLIIYVNNKSEK